MHISKVIIEEDLLSLSRGPTKYSARSNGYVFNGYRFHVEDYDKKLRTQNCGVVVLDENDEDSENLDYYGILTDDRFLKTNEPFVLADQASQVFYANDNSNKGRIVVRKTQPRDAYEIVVQIDDDIVGFEMKPLEIENKVGSNMKSTITYTFIARGAIGKSLLSQSSDLVKKYIKEIETMGPSSIGNGLNQKSRSLSSSVGISEYDVGSFNKSVVCANQHMQSPSKSRKSGSTFSYSQIMQKVKKNVLEKEDMQTTVSLPPSSDQVMKHSQTTENGSSNPTKVRKVRGSNKCKEDASLEIGQKLQVSFYNNRTVGTNSNLFSRHLGKIVRDRNICPLGVSSWHDIKQEKLNHMWAAVERKFESVDTNEHRDHILGWMNELWNKWRGHLHANYVKDKPIQQSLKNVPTGVDKKEWKCIKHVLLRNILTAQLEEMVQADQSLPTIEIVEKCCGPQTHSHVFGFGGGVKAKDLKGGTSSKAELLSALRSTRENIKSLNEENKSLNEENKYLNDRLSTIEDAMKEIMKMKELFAAQQSHVPPITSVSIE
ncbi:hypothetical protein KY290_007733 [Solanum tuberosum]|uniref:Transposon protein, CACTA, En/Spm sub-class n=1 Tax=Solanum tuberosum TaxID=4113 RepID=A0ABQ7W6I8_SOLTU|nr:hypothetical protein KY290_007733 [Solanum tuberosum]